MRYTGRRLGARVALLTPAASLAEAEALCRGVETVQTAALGAAHRDTLRRWRRGGSSPSRRRILVLCGGLYGGLYEELRVLSSGMRG